MIRKNIKIFQKLYDLSLWYFNHTEKFPKSKRFSLSVKIEKLLLSMLEMSNVVQYKKDKKYILLKLSDKLEKLKILTRFAMDAKCLNLKSYEYSAKEMDEIGKMIGGWIRTIK